MNLSILTSSKSTLTERRAIIVADIVVDIVIPFAVQILLFREAQSIRLSSGLIRSMEIEVAESLIGWLVIDPFQLLEALRILIVLTGANRFD